MRDSCGSKGMSFEYRHSFTSISEKRFTALAFFSKLKVRNGKGFVEHSQFNVRGKKGT